MDALARQEYPAMLASLTPTQAATLFNERVKRIDKVNNEVADWIQERCKVEELYAQSLRKLAAKQPPGNKSELGIFTTPWAKIVSGTEQLAHSHSQFAERIENDVEHALRSFSSKNNEMASISNIQGNLTALAKEVETAQEASDKLAKKGGKASASKVDAATSKLETKRTAWDSQAPFIFEKLQGLDESRLNHLRDVLTQLGTHETDMVERNRSTVEGTLNSLLEIDTAVEIHNFSANATGGKPRRPAPRQGSSVSQSARSVMSNNSSQLAPPTPTMQRPSVEDSASQHSGRNELSSQGSDKKESGLKRFGTMLKGRRQSIHAGAFGGGSFARSKDGDFSALGPPPTSRDGNRPIPSPRASSGNLREPSRGNSTLGAVEEQPASEVSVHHDPVNGHDGADSQRPLHSDSQPGPRGVKTPPGPPPPRKHGSHQEFHAPPSRQDSEGFSVPPPRDDPMTQALAEAAEENDSVPAFKLNIKPEAIQEEGDAEAALSTVADKLRGSVLQPQRSVGTVRGRREIRNTMYIPAADHPGGVGGFPEPLRSVEAPASLANSQSFGNIQPSAPASMANGQTFGSGQASPSMPTGQTFNSTTSTAVGGRNAALAALQGQSNERVGSSSDSIRSAGSSTNRSSAKHPEMKEPGFNAAIVETVHALFKNGELTDINVHGDIAVQFNPVDEEKYGADEIRIKSINPVGTLVPNAAFIHAKRPSSSTEGEPNDNPEDQNYILTLPNPCIPLSAFKYKLVPGADARQQYLPLMMEVESKNVGENATGVVFNYFINPRTRLGKESDEVRLDKLTFLLRYSGEVQTCQSKPASRHVKERKCVYFTLGDVTLKKGEKYKVIARLGGKAVSERPKVEVIEAAFEAAWFSDLNGLKLERRLVTREADPFGDTEEMVETTSWEPVEMRRKVVGRGDFSMGDNGETDTIEERPLSPRVGA